MIATEGAVATIEAPVNSTDRPPLPTPPLTAQELHQILLKAYRVGNCVRKKFILALYAVYAGRLYLALGSQSIVQYAAKHFGCTASQTYGFLRVAAKVGGLPQCDRAFLEGDICWSALRQVVRIANKDTEAEWVHFAKTHSLCHHGRLFIEGNPVDGIVWRTKADGLKLAVDEEMRQSAAVPEVRVVVAAAGHEVDSPATSVSPPEAEVAAPQGSGVHTVHSPTYTTAADRVVIKVLTNLGLSRKEADRRLAAARERLQEQPGTPSESDLICETLRL